MKGKRVLLTGVSRGIGLKAAERLLEEGAEVIGVARNKANLEKARKKLKPFRKTVTFLLADVSKPNAGPKIKAAVGKRWGALDLLVNNAAILIPNETWAKEDESDLEKTLRVNVLGPHRIIRVLLPLLRKGNAPRVINVSSGAGMIKGNLDGSGLNAQANPSYCLSKVALNGLTLLYSNHYRGQVSFISLDPGWIKTDMGGPNAMEETPAAAQRVLDAALMPSSVTGKFFKGKDELPW
jgi:NAD(P)-dependent dehydrogenase (short-subunit alcohol dehydrogenase family)